MTLGLAFLADIMLPEKDDTRLEAPMPYRLLLAMTLSILCALTITGCVPQKPVSPSIFFGNCITPPGPDPCESDMEICRVYQDVITEEYPSAQACRAACNQSAKALGIQYFGRTCGYMVLGGCNLCEQQCLRLYPERQ